MQCCQLSSYIAKMGMSGGGGCVLYIFSFLAPKSVHSKRQFHKLAPEEERAVKKKLRMVVGSWKVCVLLAVNGGRGIRKKLGPAPLAANAICHIASSRKKSREPTDRPQFGTTPTTLQTSNWGHGHACVTRVPNFVTNRLGIYRYALQ